MFTTNKLDALRQRWVSDLASYNFTIKYRSGKQYIDADVLSRRHESSNTVFLEASIALSKVLTIGPEDLPFAETPVFNDIGTLVSNADELQISVELLNGMSLKSHDWIKAKKDDSKTNIRPTKKEIEMLSLNTRLLFEWER